MALWYLFDSTTRKVGNTNVALWHLPLETTSKGFDEEKAHYDCFNEFYIQRFSNV